MSRGTFILQPDGAMADVGSHYSNEYDGRFGTRRVVGIRNYKPMARLKRRFLSGGDDTLGAYTATQMQTAFPTLILKLREIKAAGQDTAPFESFVQTRMNFTSTDMNTLRALAFAPLIPKAAIIEPTPAPAPIPVVEPTPVPISVVDPTPEPEVVIEETPSIVTAAEVTQRLRAYDDVFNNLPEDLKLFLKLNYLAWLKNTTQLINTAYKDPTYSLSQRAALKSDGIALLSTVSDSGTLSELWNNTPDRIRRYWLNMYRYKILRYVVNDISSGAALPTDEIHAPWLTDVIRVSALRPSQPASPFLVQVAPGITPTTKTAIVSVTPPATPIDPTPTPISVAVPPSPVTIDPAQIVKGRGMIKIVGEPTVTIIRPPNFKVGIPVIIDGKELTLWAFHPPKTEIIRDADDAGEGVSSRHRRKLVGRDLESFIFEPETLSGADYNQNDNLGFISAIVSAAKSVYKGAKKILGKGSKPGKPAASMLKIEGSSINAATPQAALKIRGVIKRLKAWRASGKSIAGWEPKLTKMMQLTPADITIIQNVLSGKGDVTIVTPTGAAKLTANLYRSKAHIEGIVKKREDAELKKTMKEGTASDVRVLLAKRIKTPYDPAYLLNGEAGVDELGYQPFAPASINLLPKKRVGPPTRSDLLREIKEDTSERELRQTISNEKAKIKAYRKKNIAELGKIRTLLNMLKKLGKESAVYRYINHYNTAGVRAKRLDQRLIEVGTVSGSDTSLGLAPFIVFGLSGLVSLLGWQALDYKKEADSNEIKRKELEMIASGQVSPSEIVSIKAAGPGSNLSTYKNMAALALPLGLLVGGFFLFRFLRK